MPRAVRYLSGIGLSSHTRGRLRGSTAGGDRQHLATSRELKDPDIAMPCPSLPTGPCARSLALGLVLVTACAAAGHTALPEPEPPPRKPEAGTSRAAASHVVGHPAPLQRLQESLARDPKACVDRVGYAGTFEKCDAVLVGNGKGILVQVVTECGGDSCSVSAWLLRGPKDPAVPLRCADGGGLAFDPTLTFYVTDRQRFTGDSDTAADSATFEPELGWVKLEADEPWQYAPCMSPTLSPGGGWFACRNRYGDVLRVPVAGGTPELVHAAATNREPDFVPYAYVYPDAVRFESNQLVLPEHPDGESETIAIPWTEDPLPPLRRVGEATADGRTMPWPSLPLFCEALGDAAPPAARAFCGTPPTAQLPALSQNGRELVVLRSEAPCCAQSSEDTAVWYDLADVHAPRKPREQMLYGTDADGATLLPLPTTIERIAALSAQMRASGMQPLGAIPLPLGPPWGVASSVELDPGEVLILGTQLVRLLRAGRVVFWGRVPPIRKPPHCCGTELKPDGTRDGLDGCDTDAHLTAAWYSPSHRLLVMELRNDDGADSCESKPRFDILQLPPAEALPSFGGHGMLPRGNGIRTAGSRHR